MKAGARAARIAVGAGFGVRAAERMPERNILDMLANVAHWTAWPRHLGPLSGSEPKLADPIQRYILTVFAYG